MTDKVVVLCNCGTAEEAERVARHLVEQRVAACVNIVPGVRSIYRWQGAVEDAAEWTLLIKTTGALVPAVEREVRALHSYEVPEVIAVPILAGFGPYLDWIESETGS